MAQAKWRTRAACVHGTGAIQQVACRDAAALLIASFFGSKQDRYGSHVCCQGLALIWLHVFNTGVVAVP
jgi:hypothetical protein